MDIQKEREAFELWCVKNDEFCIHRYDGSDDYSDDYTQCAWLAWQAAKAQAIPDDCKVVPVNYECAWCGCTELDGWTDEAMLEAQEPK